MADIVNDFTYRGTLNVNFGKIFDKLLEFYPENTAITTAVASPVIKLDTGFVDADLVLAVATSTGANSVQVQWSDTEDFATTVNGVEQEIPATTDNKIIVPFRNDWLESDVQPKAYMRLMPTVGGTLNMGAYLTKK